MTSGKQRGLEKKARDKIGRLPIADLLLLEKFPQFLPPFSGLFHYEAITHLPIG